MMMAGFEQSKLYSPPRGVFNQLQELSQLEKLKIELDAVNHMLELMK